MPPTLQKIRSLLLGLPLLAACGASAGVTPTTYTYKVVDKCEIKADVYRPAGKAVCPAIILMHGGSLISGSRKDPMEADRYVAAGIAVVVIDYRLAPETKLPVILEDLRDAYQWVRQKGPGLFQVDPNRVALVGHSAGAYLTLAGGYVLEPRPKALVSFYGYGDVDGAWANPEHLPDHGETWIPRSDYEAASSHGPVSAFPPSDPARSLVKGYIKQQRLWTKEVTGIDPATAKPGAYDRFCPIRNVTPQYPPTMLMHGDQDKGVPYQESVDMEKELKSKGVETQLIIIKGAAHGFEWKFLNEEQRVELYGRVVAFLNSHFKKP